MDQTLLGADGVSLGRRRGVLHKTLIAILHELRFAQGNLVLFHTGLTVSSTTGAAMPSVVQFADGAETIARYSCVSGRGSDSSSVSATRAPLPSAGVGHVSLSAKCPARFMS